MINNHPAHPLLFERTNPIPTEETCVICSENFQLGEKVLHHTGGAQHPFHMDCIRRIRESTCPMCRAPIHLHSIDLLETTAERRSRVLRSITRHATLIGFAFAMTETVWRLDRVFQQCHNLGPISFRDHYLLQLFHQSEIKPFLDLLYSSRNARYVTLAELLTIFPAEGVQKHLSDFIQTLLEAATRFTHAHLPRITEPLTAAWQRIAEPIFAPLQRMTTPLITAAQRIAQPLTPVMQAALAVNTFYYSSASVQILRNGRQELNNRLKQPVNMLDSPQTKLAVTLHYLSLIGAPILRKTLHPFSLEEKTNLWLQKLGFDDVILYGITRKQIATVISNIAYEAIEQVTLTAIYSFIDPRYALRLNNPQPMTIHTSAIRTFILSAPGRLLAKTFLNKGLSLSRHLLDYADITLPLKGFCLLYSLLRNKERETLHLQ